jgi:hypothetical protein
MKYINMKPNRIILIVCCIAFSLNLMANEVITITWKPVSSPYGPIYYKNISITATINKNFTVDWGDGSNIETKIGTGDKQIISHTYADSKDYIATISGSSTDCLFTYLDCANNGITILDVSTNISLKTLLCNSNQITSLSINNLIALTDIDCEYNQISSIDVSNASLLAKFNCSGNRISILNVNNNMALISLKCYNNKISSLDVSNNTALKTLFCGENLLSDLELNTNILLTYLDCFNNNLKKLNLSVNPLLEHLECSRNQLNSLVFGENSALVYLYCWGNQLDSLDVSGNTAIEVLSCSYNMLSNLDLSNNTALVALHCNENDLNNLNVSKNTKLREIECRRNHLNTLDLSKHPLLFTLECGDNELNSLILNANAPFDRTLTCEYNRLRLSDLFEISKMIENGAYRKLTPQFVATQPVAVNTPVDLTSQSMFNGIATAFKVIKDGWPAPNTEYSINGAIVTFKKEGNFGVMMENSAIVSQWSEPALVFEYFTVGNVGIVDITQMPNILVYPNPTTDKVYMKTETEIVPEVKLYSVNGKLLQHLRSTEIDVSSYSAGIYILQVADKMVKIVKSKE